VPLGTTGVGDFLQIVPKGTRENIYLNLSTNSSCL